MVLRDDDQESIIRKRLDIYHDQTEPLIGFYQAWSTKGDQNAPAFHQISGEGSVDVIFDRILSVIKE